MSSVNPYYPIVELTQEQYDALAVKSPNTLYAIPYGGSPAPTPTALPAGVPVWVIPGAAAGFAVGGIAETEES